MINALLRLPAYIQQATTTAGKAGKESTLCSSFPPSVGPLQREQQQQQQHAEKLTAASSADRRSSSVLTNTATSTGRPSVESCSEERLARDESAPLTEATTVLLDAAETARAQNAWGWGHDIRLWRAQGGAVKAIVSADYSGEIKVFLGFVGD